MINCELKTFSVKDLTMILLLLWLFVDMWFWFGPDRLPGLAVISDDSGGCNAILPSARDLDGSSAVHSRHWYLVRRMYNCRASRASCPVPSQQPSTTGILVF